MTTTQTAVSLLDRLHDDHDFAVEVQRLATDAAALMDYLHAEGFDVTDDEVREAFLERYGDQLTTEQLEAVSGGFIQLLALLVAAGVGVAVGVAIGSSTNP